MYMYTHIMSNTHVGVYIYKGKHIHIHVCGYICIRPFVGIDMNTYVNTFVHIDNKHNIHTYIYI